VFDLLAPKLFSLLINNSDNNLITKGAHDLKLLQIQSSFVCRECVSISRHTVEINS
jgi:hypothetical protein